jgi:broad specificity phosphatase PhoE
LDLWIYKSGYLEQSEAKKIMEIFFVRHGESEANIQHVISNRGYIHGLTIKGREQSMELADTLKFKQIRQVFSSPLLRAVETAQILADRLDCPLEITDALREFDCGILEGKSDSLSWKLHSQIFDQWKDGKWDYRIQDGESFNDMRDRFLPYLGKILNEYQGTKDNFIMVGHGGLYHCMLPLVIKNLELEFFTGNPLSNTGYIHVESIEGELRFQD